MTVNSSSGELAMIFLDTEGMLVQSILGVGVTVLEAWYRISWNCYFSKLWALFMNYKIL